MSQLSINFGSAGLNVSAPGCDPGRSPKDSLTIYINAVGLVAFKDFFMKVKSCEIEEIPPGMSRPDFMALCREVYQARAKAVERQDNRAKFFRIRNGIKRNRK